MMRQVFLLAVLAATASTTLEAQLDSSVVSVQGGPYLLKVAMYRQHAVEARTLVVVLHGDAPFNKPDYQDRFAAAIAARDSGVVAAAILRPGYTDPAGHTSEGNRGEATGDSYNAANTDAIAAAIKVLQAQFHSTRVLLVGHSGGAAIAANIMGRHPGIATAALLVSCPCDVVAWRQHMFKKTGFAGFDGPLETLSPIDLASTLSPAVQVRLIVGEKDDVAPPALTNAYAARARSHATAVDVLILPDKGHEILLEPRVLEAVRDLLAPRSPAP